MCGVEPLHQHISWHLPQTTPTGTPSPSVLPYTTMLAYTEHQGQGKRGIGIFFLMNKPLPHPHIYYIHIQRSCLTLTSHLSAGLNTWREVYYGIATFPKRAKRQALRTAAYSLPAQHTSTRTHTRTAHDTGTFSMKEALLRGPYDLSGQAYASRSI